MKELNTNEHNTIRGLLSLAAAGALDPGEQRRVEEHLLSCTECSREFQMWSQIAGSLAALPAPQAPAGLLARTRATLDAANVRKAELWRNQLLLAGLILFGWIVTLASFPVLHMAGNGVARWLDLPAARMGVWVNWYLVLGWFTSGIAAGLLGLRSRHERRTI